MIEETNDHAVARALERRVMPQRLVLVSYGAGTNSTAMLVEMVRRS